MGRTSRSATVKSKMHLLKNTDLPSILNPAVPTTVPAATKVIVTLGPACRDVELLEKLLEAGMTAARVDLTWGPVEYHQQSLRNLNEAVRRSKRLCAIVVDTLGRELMIRRSFALNESGWPVHNEELHIKKGQTLTVSGDPAAVASDTVLPITHPGFAAMVRPGDTLFIGRYLVSGAEAASLYAEVTEVRGMEVLCEADNDAELTGLLTVIHSSSSDEAGLSNLQAELPLLAAHDVNALQTLAREFEVDYVAATYTHSGADVDELRDFLDRSGLEHTKILAKVENKQALYAFESIALAADGVIMSRGNLGLDVAPEKMAQLQKSIISRCNALGKPVLLTRLVDTMATTPRPTRAEATDVANAVLDGVDGLLLGAETLRGRYPLATVTTVLQCCRQAEETFDHRRHFDFLMELMMQEELEEESVHGGNATGGPAARVSAEELSPADLQSPRSRVSSGELPPLPKAVAGLRTGELRSPRSSGPGPTAPSKSAMPKVSSFGSLPRPVSAVSVRSQGQYAGLGPSMPKVEAIASTAVRAADKINAGLIIVFSHSGRTASLVAKYRPPMPILALVVPQLRVQGGHQWDLQGRLLARQFLAMRGIVPMLTAPLPGSSDSMLGEAVAVAVQRGLVRPLQHIVCVMTIKENLVLKIVSVDEAGGLKVSSRGSEASLAALGHTPSSADLHAASAAAQGNSLLTENGEALTHL